MCFIPTQSRHLPQKFSYFSTLSPSYPVCSVPETSRGELRTLGPHLLLDSRYKIKNRKTKVVKFWIRRLRFFVVRTCGVDKGNLNF